jgi:hypothetical protein
MQPVSDKLSNEEILSRIGVLQILGPPFARVLNSPTRPNIKKTKKTKKRYF